MTESGATPLPNLEHETEISRGVEVATGVVAALVGAPTLAFGLFFLVAAFEHDQQSVIGWAVALGSLLLGSTLVTASWRLLSGRRNRGGLFSPAALRLAAILGFASAALVTYAGGWQAAQALESAVFSVACWTVARARERKLDAVGSSHPTRPH
jgi:hypothetical protein